MTKSIFEKSYMIRSQAEKAATKEFGNSWVQTHEIYARPDIMPIRWAVRALSPVNALANAHAVLDEQIDALSDEQAQALAITEGMKKGDAREYLKSLHPEDAERVLAMATAAPATSGRTCMDDDAGKPRISSCERPTKKVWEIADCMPKASRKEVMAECVAQGIAYGTARTQYQAWFKASQECERMDIRRPYQKGE